MQRLLSLTLTALLCGAAGAAAHAQSITVPLSNPSRPVTLEIKMAMGDVHVKAYDGNQVLVMTDDSGTDFNARDRDNEDTQREREGLHQIPNTSSGLTIEESENVVTVATDFTRHHSDLVISVPRRTSVHAKTIGGGGDLSIVGVTGEHELSNMNGDVTATDISGTIVATTTNGDIDVSLAELTAGKAMSFSSFNGDIDVALPANVKADLIINSAQGDVWTDFEVALQPQASVVEPAEKGGDRYRVRMQREMRATINGGGPELRFKTFHGDVTIRKRK